MIGIGINTTLRVISGGGGPSYDVDAQAFFDRVTTAGGTLTTTEKNATNQLVLDMKSAGIWSAMKAVYPMVGASVNLLSYSNTFSNSAWTKSGGTILSTNNLDPNGNYTASRIDLPTASVSQIYNLISTAASTYTSSMWIRLVSGSGAFQFGFYDGTSFLTNAITVTSTWQRFSVAKTNSSSSSTRGCWLYSNDPNQVIEVYGGQVELGSTATTYAPVSGSRTAEASAACAQNLKSSSFTGTFSSGWTFSSSGAKGNGTSAKMETALNPNTQLNINSTHISYYSNDAFSVENVFMSNNTLDLFIQQNGGVFYGSLATPSYGSTGNALKLAFMMYNRPNSTHQKAIKNNTILQDNTQLAVSFSSTDVKLNNYIGTYTDSRCAFASLGDGLTDTQASNFYTAVQAFQTTLARQVV